MNQVTKMSWGPTPVGEHQLHLQLPPIPPVINATAAQEQVVFGSVLCSFLLTVYVLPAACLCFSFRIISQILYFVSNNPNGRLF